MKTRCTNIFIVEDDSDTTEAMELCLETGGYVVESFSDGNLALARLRTFPEPCLIFLDMMMPIMSGYQFMQELKKGGGSIVSIPVYLCSASASSEDSKAMGCHGFMKKPFDLNLLMGIVEKYCETKAAWAQNTLRAEGNKHDLKPVAMT